MDAQLQLFHIPTKLCPKEERLGAGDGDDFSPYSSLMEEIFSQASQQTSRYNSFSKTESHVHLWSNLREGRMGPSYLALTNDDSLTKVGPIFSSHIAIGKLNNTELLLSREKVGDDW